MAAQVKISERSKKIIQEIADETGESPIAVLEHAILAYHREWRMQKLRQNKQAWKEELKERGAL